jgi:uncharacterized protein YhhL (DUF1145 family)
MTFSVFLYSDNYITLEIMIRNIPEKFIKASNLIFFVTFLKIMNIIILDYAPTGKIPLKMFGILALFIACGFMLRRGYKWMIYLMPAMMLFPWVLLQTNIIHIFRYNTLAGIITLTQFLLQVIIMEILLTSSKVTEGDSRRSARIIRT